MSAESSTARIFLSIVHSSAPPPPRGAGRNGTRFLSPKAPAFNYERPAFTRWALRDIVPKDCGPERTHVCRAGRGGNVPQRAVDRRGGAGGITGPPARLPPLRRDTFLPNMQM